MDYFLCLLLKITFTKKCEIEISNFALLQYETERFNGRGKTLAQLEFSPVIKDGRALTEGQAAGKGQVAGNITKKKTTCNINHIRCEDNH